MKNVIKYYYVRSANNEPLITICLSRIEGQTSRGIAICSDKDNPCKKIGRDIAYGRALKAIFNGKSGDRVNRPLFLHAWLISSGFESPMYKSEYNPNLTAFELKLLTNTPKEYIQQEMPFDFDDKIRSQTK